MGPLNVACIVVAWTTHDFAEMPGRATKISLISTGALEHQKECKSVQV